MIICQQVKKDFLARGTMTPLHWEIEEFTVTARESVLITGPSGCGKTTLLNMLSGLLRPDSGSISIQGIKLEMLDIARLDIFRGGHIGMIFQSFQLLSALTVAENLLLGARFGRKWTHHEALEHTEMLLREVGLWDRRTHRPGELSIGEQQRVAIARALINRPALLLADEPTASLDAANVTTVLDLIFKLCAENDTTLVAVSHDTSIAARFSRTVDAGNWLHRREVSHV